MDFFPDFEFPKLDVVDCIALLVIQFIILAAIWQFVRKRPKPSRPSFAKTIAIVLLVEVVLFVVLSLLLIVAFGISMWFVMN